MSYKKKKRLLIILNPTAGGGRANRKFSHIVDKLKRSDLTITVIETEYAGHGRLIAEQNVGNNYDMVVAAGGDGTLNEVLNGIYPHQIPFGIIPLGTVNVLAKEINLKCNADDIADCLIESHIVPIWIGVSNDQYFFLMVSAGLDSLSVAHVSSRLKKLIGKSAYALSFLWQVFKSKNVSYEVNENGKTHTASNVIVSNGRLYGGQYICAPEARLDEKCLYLLMATRTGRFNSIKYAYLMLTQQYPYCNSVISMPITKAIIRCNDANMPIQIDGDYGGNLPVEIGISEKSVNLVQPL